MKKWYRKGQLYKRGKRSLALLLSVCLIGTMIPVTARAESGNTNTGLCEHHTEHTSECGYVESSEGSSCTYVCEICAEEAKQGETNVSEETLTVQAASKENKVITDWEWVDDWEIIDPDSGNALLPFASVENVVYYDNIVEMLPIAILADGAELTLGEWVCENYPMESGAYEGEYVFETTLPEGYVLSEGGNVLRVSVVMGFPEGHAAVTFSSGHTHCVCGATHQSIGDHTGEQTVEWQPWGDEIDDNLPSDSGNYYLTKDINMYYGNGALPLHSGRNINLCLNGHSITTRGGCYKLESGATLTITDCVGGGKIKPGLADGIHYDNAILVASGGQFNFFNGNVIDHERIVYNSGTFKMYGGTLGKNADGADRGGGVYNNGTFYMYGGAIKDCKVQFNTNYGGGGIYNEGIVYMSGGSITGCSLSSGGTGTTGTTRGSGVYNDGQFYMSGGSITGNKAHKAQDALEGYGSGFFNIGTLNLSGNVNITENFIGQLNTGTPSNLVIWTEGSRPYSANITENLDSGARIAVTHRNGAGTVAKVKQGVTADYSCFSSDNTAWKARKDSSGNIVLVDANLVDVTGTVKVVDTAMSGATLTFQSESFTGSCTTDSSGKYCLSLNPGTYQVSLKNSSGQVMNIGEQIVPEGEQAAINLDLTKLTGTVKDNNNNPVENAKICFGSDTVSGYTNANGEYTVWMLRDKYSVGAEISTTVQTLLYAPVTENVTFQSNGMTKDFVLSNMTDGNTLQVSSEADLVRLASFESQLGGKTIVLTQDIALTGVFEGITLTDHRNITIQGNGHTISNMTTPLFVKQDTMSRKYLKGEVRDLHLQGDISWNGYRVGSLAEETDSITIDGCSFTGRIISTYEDGVGKSIGGLVGSLWNSTMKNCHVSLSEIKSIKNLDYSGGLCGEADSENNTIENCYVRIGNYNVDYGSGMLDIYAGTVKNCYVVVTGDPKPKYALGSKNQNKTAVVSYVFVQDGSADGYANTIQLSAELMIAKAGTTVGDNKALVDCLNAQVTDGSGYKKWYNGDDGYPCFTAPIYTITFRGGSKGTGSQDALSVAADKSVTLPGAVYKNSDYVQKGWSTTENGAKAYDLGASISPTEDMTLYPYWDLKPVANCTAPTGLTATYGDTLKDVSLSDNHFTWNTPNASVGDVGDHTFTATYTPTGEEAEIYRKNTDVQVSVKVEKAQSRYTTQVSKATNLTYNRTAQELVTAGTTSDGTIVYSLTGNDDYSSTIPTATNPGNYTVYYKIQGDANHEDSEVKSVSVSIGKANLTDAVITLGDALTYNGESQTQSIASVEVANMILGVGDYTVTNNTGSAVGTYTLTVTGQGNFEGSATKEFKIAKKAAVSVPDIDKKYVYAAGSKGAVVNIDIASLLPNDRGVTTYSLATNSAEYVTEKAVGTDGILTYKVGTNGSVDDSTILTVTASSDNYEDITVKVNIQIVDKYTVIEMESAKVAIVGSNTLTYGQMLSTLTLNTSAAGFVEEGNPTKEVTGTLSWKTPDEKPNAGTTSATWIFTPDDEAYATVEDTVAITVNKATPQVTALPTVAARTYHPTKRLADSDLTGGTVTGVDGNPLGGSWSWQSAGIIPTVNNSGYVAVFTPTDSTNYETVTKTITVTVSKATPYIKTAPTADTITYGDTLGDSAILGGTVQYSDNDATTIAGSFAWKDSSVKPSVSDSDITAYRVVFNPSDTENYNTAETDITLTVNKADNAPNMPSSTMNVANSCEKVSDVTLPTGWVWQDADKDTALAVDTPVTATAEYNGADKGNYVNETVSVTITRSACDHVHTEIRNAKEATCKETGYTGDTYCTDCGALLSTGTTIPLADHQGGIATCTKKAVCTVCGKEYGTLDANNHAHTEIKGAVAATCTAGGYTGDTYCTDCGVKTKTGTVTPALGHSYTGKVTTEPTTEKEGVRTYTCERCGHSYTESIPKLPEQSHAHFHIGTVSKAATCTENGVTIYSCSCGDSYTETIPALGHHYISRVTKKPTTGSEGVMTYTCDRCGHSFTRAIAKLQNTNPTKPASSNTANSNPEDNNSGDNNSEENNPEDNKPDTGKPYIKDENGKEGWDVIKDEVDKVKDGDTVTVEMNGTSVVPGDVLDDIKGKDVTIVFDMGGGITWSVNGKSITADRVGDIDFTVKADTNTIPVDIINNVTGERYSKQISLSYDGEFGFTAVLSVNMDSGNAGLYANLFYYNEKTGEMEFICYDEIAEDGTAELTFTHASDYAIIIDREPMGEIAQVDSPASESQDTETETTQPDAVANDDAWNPWWMIIIGIAVIVIGLGVFLVVKKKKSGAE